MIRNNPAFSGMEFPDEIISHGFKLTILEIFPTKLDKFAIYYKKAKVRTALYSSIGKDNSTTLLCYSKELYTNYNSLATAGIQIFGYTKEL